MAIVIVVLAHHARRSSLIHVAMKMAELVCVAVILLVTLIQSDALGEFVYVSFLDVVNLNQTYWQ